MSGDESRSARISPARLPAHRGPKIGPGFALAIVGFAAVILAAREQIWTLGHWSQDLSPVPLLAGIAVLSTALDGLGALGTTPPDTGEVQLLKSTDMRGWHYLGIVLTAIGLALLGRSGLGLAFAVVIAVALAGIYAIAPRPSG